MDSHNKLTLGSGWCSTQLMPVLIRAWKYYLGLAARSKKSILSQVINSALSDCSPIPGSFCVAVLAFAFEIFSMTCTFMLVLLQKKRQPRTLCSHRVFHEVLNLHEKRQEQRTPAPREGNFPKNRKMPVSLSPLKCIDFNHAPPFTSTVDLWSVKNLSEVISAALRGGRLSIKQINK